MFSFYCTLVCGQSLALTGSQICIGALRHLGPVFSRQEEARNETSVESRTSIGHRAGSWLRRPIDTLRLGACFILRFFLSRYDMAQDQLAARIKCESQSEPKIAACDGAVTSCVCQIGQRVHVVNSESEQLLPEYHACAQCSPRLNVIQL